MRRKDREIDSSEAWRILEESPFQTLSMVRPDGSPYGIPLSCACLGEGIVFHSALNGEKIEALTENPRVSLLAVSGVFVYRCDFTTAYSSALFEGNVQEILGEKEKIAALRVISQRYTPHLMERFDQEIAMALGRTRLYELTPVKISAKANPPEKSK